MTQQSQQWQTNQHLRDLNYHLPLAIDAQKARPAANDEYSPTITFTPAQPSNPMFPFPFGLDDITPSMPHVLDEDSMDSGSAAISSAHALMSNDSSRLHRLLEGGPWDPQSITSHPHTSTSYSEPPRFITNRSTIVRPAGNFHTSYHRMAPASNPESHSALINPLHPFIGLQNARTTRSVVSGSEAFDLSTDEASGLGGLTEAAVGINLNASHSSPGYGYNPHFDARTEPDLLSPNSKMSFRDASSTASLGGSTRKKKAHLCNVPGCDNRKGFGSSNDLERHRKSVHRIPPTHGRDRSWKCSMEGCKTPNKIWPRLDNFKNHCKNCHKNVNVDEIVRRSEIKQEDLPLQDAADETSSIGNIEQSNIDNQADSKSLLMTLAKDDTLSVASSRGKSRGTISRAELAKLSNDYNGDSFHDRMSFPSFGITGSSNVEAGYPEDVAMPPAFLTRENSGEEEGNEQQFISTAPPDSHFTVSNHGLQSFSSNLLEGLTDKLGLDQSSRDIAQDLISRSMKQLLNPDQESSTGTPDTSATAIVGDSVKSSAKKSQCDFPGCGKVFERPCELRKHFVRHTKPYFCTWADCTSKKAFGSKADWTRHEKTLHYKHLAHRCQEPSQSVADDVCDRLFTGSETFAMHLRGEHGILNPYEINQKVGEKKPSPTSYWCGFCSTMRPINILESEDLLKERFDHIDEHMKLGKTIDEWFPEYNVYGNAHQTSSIMNNGKRGNENTSTILDLQGSDLPFEMGFYNEYEDHEQQYPRLKRARAHEPENHWDTDPQTTAITMQSEDQDRTINNSNEWMNESMTDGMMV